LGKRIEWEGKVKGRNLDDQWNKTHFMTTYAQGMRDKAGMSKIMQLDRGLEVIQERLF